MQITISAKSADMRRGYVCVPHSTPPPSSVYGFDAFEVGFSDFFLSSPKLKAQLSFLDNLLSFVCPFVSLSVFLGKGDISLFKWWPTLDSEKANYIHWRNLINIKLNLAKSTYVQMNDHVIYQWGDTSKNSNNTLTTFKNLFWGGAKPQGQFNQICYRLSIGEEDSL